MKELNEKTINYMNELDKEYSIENWMDRDTNKIMSLRKKIFEEFLKSIEDYEFYSKDLKEIVYDKIVIELAYKIGLLYLDKIAREENLVIDTSPYSYSVYALKDGESVDWGYKPNASYRLSDHWHFESRGEWHCKLEDKNKHLKNKILLCKYENGKYIVIKNLSDEIKKSYKQL